MVMDLVKPGIKVCAQNCSATGAGAFTGEINAAQVKEAGLKVIYCIGEQLEDREAGKTNDVIAQHMATVYACPDIDYERVVIAYEPVWAIGTGKVATAAQAEDAHQYTRELTAEKVSKNVADGLRIQYGGSVSPSNCVELMSCPNVDGFLVGGASLKPDFCTIIKAAAEA